jgi:Xaa-Pro aminopeptidase
MIAKMSRENRAAVLTLLKKFYQTDLKKPFPKKSLLYLKGSLERPKNDDDTSHQVHYEANFSYLVGINCVYYDSVIDFEKDEVYLVDILDTYKNNKWVQGVTPEKLKEFQLSGIINKNDLTEFIQKRTPEVIFINRGIARLNGRWSNFWIPNELETFRDIMDLDSTYPLINLARTRKNPTEIELMKEVILI